MAATPGSYIVAGARTPIGKMSGAFSSFSAADLGGFAISAALERSGVAPDEVQHVIMGQVLMAGQGQVPSRQAAVKAGIAAIAEILPTGTPTFGICLGHQLLAKAAGAETYKLKFGHRGANHAVRNDSGAPDSRVPHLAREGESVEITSQNHGFAVDAESLPEDGPFGAVVQTHVNLSDWTNEGLALVDLPAFSVQYHPEAAPGPHDARYLFGQFIDLMERHQ